MKTFQKLLSLLAACVFLNVANADLALAQGTAKPEEAKIPAGYKLVFEENFESADALKNFAFSDPNAWRWSDMGKGSGSLELHRQSKYETKYRSPFNIALIHTKRVGNFVMEADMLQTGKEYGHRDMCMYFGFQSPTQFYYTHLATKPDPNAHNIFIVNEAPRKSFAPISPSGIDWGSDWQHVRLEREGDAIRVFYQDMRKPVLEANNSEFKSGYVGVGSFDDTGKIDNIRVWAAEATDGKLPLFPSK